MIGLRCQADDRQKLRMLGVAHAARAGCGRVGMDAIGASVGGGDCNVDHLSHQGVECSFPRHDGLQTGPCALKKRGVDGERTPEIVDEIRLPRSADIVEDGKYVRIVCGLRVAYQLDGGHQVPLFEYMYVPDSRAGS